MIKPLEAYATVVLNSLTLSIYKIKKDKNILTTVHHAHTHNPRGNNIYNSSVTK